MPRITSPSCTPPCGPGIAGSLARRRGTPPRRWPAGLLVAFALTLVAVFTVAGGAGAAPHRTSRVAAPAGGPTPPAGGGSGSSPEARHAPVVVTTPVASVNCTNGVTPCGDTLRLAPNTSGYRTYTANGFTLSALAECRMLSSGVTCAVISTLGGGIEVRYTAGSSPTAAVGQLWQEAADGSGDVVWAHTTVIVSNAAPCGSLAGAVLAPCDTAMQLPVGDTRDVVFQLTPTGLPYTASCMSSSVATCTVADTLVSGSKWRVRFTGAEPGQTSGQFTNRVSATRANGDVAKSLIPMTVVATAPCASMSGVTLAPCNQPGTVITGASFSRSVTWTGGTLAGLTCTTAAPAIATCAVSGFANTASGGSATLTVQGLSIGTSDVVLRGAVPGTASDTARSVVVTQVVPVPTAPTCPFGTTPCDPSLYLLPQHDTTLTFTSTGWPSAGIRCQASTPSQQTGTVSCTLLPGATATQATVKVRTSEYMKGWVTLESYSPSGGWWMPVSSPIVVANGGTKPGPSCTSQYGTTLSPCDTAITVKPGARTIVHYATNNAALAVDTYCSPNTFSMCMVMGREGPVLTVGYTGLAIGQEQAPFRVARTADTTRSTATVTVTNSAAPPAPCATKTGIRVLPCDTTLTVRTGEFVDVTYRFSPNGVGYAPSCTPSSSTTVRCSIDTLTASMTYRVRHFGCAVGSATVTFRGVHPAGDTARTTASVTVGAGSTPGPECGTTQPPPGPDTTVTPADTAQPAPAPQTGRIEAATLNPGATFERSACVTLPIAKDAAYECGDLRLTYALRTVTTLGTPFTPALTYSSAHVRPMARVRVGVRLSTPPASTTDSVTMHFSVLGGLVIQKVPRSLWTDTVAARYFVLGTELSGAQTGLYPYVARVNFGTGVVDSVRGLVAVVNRDTTTFGSGWWLAGYERLYPVRPGAPFGTSADSLLWVGGDGSTRLYVATDAGSGQAHATYVAESFTRPDTLRLESGTTWVRVLPNGASTRFALSGRMTAAQDRLGQQVTYEHDTQGRLTGVRVPPTTSALLYRFAYDATGLTKLRLLRQAINSSDSTVLEERSVFRTNNLITHIYELGDGIVTLYWYGDEYRLISNRIDRRGANQQFLFTLGLTLKETRLTVTQADNSSQLIAHRYCAGEAQGLQACTLGEQPATAFTTIHDGPRTDVADVSRFVLNRFGAPLHVTDPLGEVTLVGYHAGLPGLVQRTQTPSGRVTRATYDAGGRVLVALDSNALGNGAEHRTDYSWDTACPDQVRRVAPVGAAATEYTYHPNTCLVDTVRTGADTLRRVTYTYKFGTSLVETSRTPGAPGPTTFVYDALGNLREEIFPAGNSRVRIGDVFGRDSVLSSPADSTTSRVVTLTYDALGRPTQVRDSVQGEVLVVTQAFDLEGNLVRNTRTGSYGSQGVVSLTDSVQLDAADRPIRQLDSYRPGSAPTMTYDPAGNLVLATDRRSNPLTMTYDVAGRPLTRSGYQVSDAFAYGPRGTWAAAWNAESRDTVWFTPGGLPVLQRVVRGGVGGRPIVTARLRWDYDANGQVKRRSRIIGSDSVGLAYGYDSEGRFESLTGFDGRETRVQFDRYGRPDVIRLGNGGTISLELPWTGVLSRKLYQGPPISPTNAAPVVSLGMRYDFDPKLGRYEGGAASDGTWRSYAWDRRGRLKSFADTTATNCVPLYGNGTALMGAEGEEPVGYNCTPVQGGGTTYAYDAFGNRTTAGTTLGAGHRLLTAMVGGVSYTFEHDYDGNVTRKYRTGNTAAYDQTRTWDGVGQLRTVTTSGTAVAGGTQAVEYGYDVSGLRVRRTQGGQTVYSLWDGADLVAELDGATGGVQRQWAHYPGVDQPHSIRAGGPGAPIYYHAQDGLGHVVALIDSAGRLATQRAYVPFGDAAQADSGQAIPDALRWKARERDAATGLYYVRARWYDPDVGRFSSEDPLGLTAGFNPYAFAANDPINYSDPTGLTCRALYNVTYEVTSRNGVELFRRELSRELIAYIGDCATGERGGSGAQAQPSVCSSKSFLGKVWTWPNTLIGLEAAGASYLAGKVMGTGPSFRLGNNSLQLLNSPLNGRPYALGNVQVYGTDRYMHPSGERVQYGVANINNGLHEEGHTIQAERLGPFYGIAWLIGGGGTAHNPMEQGANRYAQGTSCSAK